MFGVILVLLMGHYEHEVFLALETLSKHPLPEDIGRMKPRETALARLESVSAFGDPRVIACWRSHLQDNPDAVYFTLCTERYFHRRGFEMLIEHLARMKDPRPSYEAFYRVRRHWWHDQEIQLRLEVIASRSYEKYELKESQRFGLHEFPLWKGMCLSYAYRGDRRIEPICRRSFADKRLLRKDEEIAHTSEESALRAFPTRPCDHALIALFRLHEIDERRVFHDSGMLQEEFNTVVVVTEAQRKQIMEENRRAFDQLMADYPQVIKKYKPTK